MTFGARVSGTWICTCKSILNTNPSRSRGSSSRSSRRSPSVRAWASGSASPTTRSAARRAHRSEERPRRTDVVPYLAAAEYGPRAGPFQRTVRPGSRADPSGEDTARRRRSARAKQHSPHARAAPRRGHRGQRWRALSILEAENFDIVLCDLIMPGMTGMQLFETIRARYASTQGDREISAPAEAPARARATPAPAHHPPHRDGRGSRDHRRVRRRLAVAARLVRRRPHAFAPGRSHRPERRRPGCADPGRQRRHVHDDRPAAEHHTDHRAGHRTPTLVFTDPNSSVQIGSPLASDGIPITALEAYQDAANTINAADPNCHMPWPLLAGIGRVESSTTAATAARSCAPTAPRPGRSSGSRSTATAPRSSPTPTAAAIDGDPVYDRAVGPMESSRRPGRSTAPTATGRHRRPVQHLRRRRGGRALPVRRRRRL